MGPSRVTRRRIRQRRHGISIRKNNPIKRSQSSRFNLKGASQISNRTSNHKLGNKLQVGLQLTPQPTGGIPEVLAKTWAIQIRTRSSISMAHAFEAASAGRHRLLVGAPLNAEPVKN
jgi:hypothetical protein